MATKKAAKKSSKSGLNKSTGSKSAAEKSGAEMAVGKKPGINKSSAKKSSAKKSPAKKSSGKKYSPAAGKSVEREMKAFEEGKLKSGGGQKVTNPKQAIAIGLSEARRSGANVPAAKQS